jgi:hypothetical protein
VVERVNGSLKSILYRIQQSSNPPTKKWVKFIPDIEKAYNSTYNRSIHTSPDLAYKLEPTDVQELADKVRAKKSKGYKEITTVLKVGQKVRLVVPKLSIKRKGEPLWSTDIYTIAGIINAHPENFTQPRYKVKDSDGHLVRNTFPISSLLLLPSGYTE